MQPHIFHHMKHKIAVIEGDGVGHEIIPAALSVLDKFNKGNMRNRNTDFDHQFELVPFNIGYGRWERDGIAMTDDDMDGISKCDCVLFGAITTPPDPEYKSVLLRLRKELDLYANIRPIKSLLPDAKPVDFVIVRENTEGMYSGIEEIGEDVSTTTRIITRMGSQRIAEYACGIAKKRKGELTIVHKSNVLKSDKLFLDTCMKAAENAGVSYTDNLVDSMAYKLVRDPTCVDVIVTTNLFGDILSDMAAAFAGGLGMCASANIGLGHALFEPIHGSAPDIAGKGMANPIAAILSVRMMLEWMGIPEASVIDDAIVYVLQTGVRTPDLGGTATTSEMAESIAERVERLLQAL